MKKMSLNLEDLAVESFDTGGSMSLRGTVKARETDITGCIRTCYLGDGETCGVTCGCTEYATCPNTCAETCAQTCPVSCHNTACVAFCGGGGGNLSVAYSCAGCGDDGGMPHYTAVSPCNQTA